MNKSLLLLAIITYSNLTQAEFYAWTDRDAGRHVSNIPAEGFTADGKLKNSHNPHTIDYQYQGMLERLRQENQAIEEERAKKKNKEAFPVVEQRRAPPAAAPKEGLMGLRELIDLEKRGGRAN